MPSVQGFKKEAHLFASEVNLFAPILICFLFTTNIKDLKVGLVNSLNFEFPALWRGVQVKNYLWYQPLITPFLLKKLQGGTLLFFVYITLKLPRTKFKNKACPHGKSREVFNLKKGPCSTEFELSCPTLPSLLMGGNGSYGSSIDENGRFA